MQDKDAAFALDLKRVLNTDFGRNFVVYLMRHYGLFKTSYNENPQRMAYHEGLRQAALFLSQQISIYAPEEIGPLLKKLHEH
jgi:hypothetical protein